MKIKDLIVNSYVTFFGIGYIRLMPGTWASLASGFVLFQFWPFLDFWIKITLILTMFIVGCFCSDYVEKRDHNHDPSMIVMDEVVGMMISSMLLQQIWWQWGLAFLLFRILDIIKIWPASYFDRQKGGFSVMFDDALMAILTMAIVSAIISQI